MVTWLIFLPWAMWDSCQWLTIPVAAIITFLLLGIENIGIQVAAPLAAGQEHISHVFRTMYPMPDAVCVWQLAHGTPAEFVLPACTASANVWSNKSRPWSGTAKVLTCQSCLQIEQPFAVLPMASFPATIKRNLLDMMQQAPTAQSLAVQATSKDAQHSQPEHSQS